MGLTPRNVGAMSLYQFAACVDGWNSAHNPDAVAAPSASEFERMKQLHGDD